MRAPNTVLALALLAFGTNAVILSAQPDAGAAALREDLQARRARLMGKLGSGSMAILWSAPARVYSRDVDYEYRQDTDFYYLTRLNEPESVAVVAPSHPEHQYVLFVRARDPEQEIWTGLRAGVEGAVAGHGADAAF